MSKFKYIDLFSGIGGFRVALDKLGGLSQGFSEIDKHAIKSYKLNYNDSVEHDLGDVTKIVNLPKADVLVGGVPCQSWSVAGKMKGFEDPRGRLWFDTIKMVEISKPKVFVFENVKGLADPRNSANLQLIKENFEGLGYSVFHKTLNTYDFGLPQNRIRVFLVGFRKDVKKYSKSFNFPSRVETPKSLVYYLDNIKREYVIKKKIGYKELYDGKAPVSRNISQKSDEMNDFFVLCDTRNGHTTIHSWDIQETSKNEREICMAILKNRRKSIYGESDGNPMSFIDIQKIISHVKKQDIDSLVKKNILKYTEKGKIDLVNSKNSSGVNGIYRVYLPNSTIFSTLTATGTRDFVATKYVEGDTVEEYKINFINEILKKGNLRQVTIQEALTIQGFPKNYKLVESHQFSHKQVGNSVSPTVVEALFKKIIETEIFG